MIDLQIFGSDCITLQCLSSADSSLLLRGPSSFLMIKSFLLNLWVLYTIFGLLLYFVILLSLSNYFNFIDI